MASPGAALIPKVQVGTALGFIPEAVHFELFQTLVKLQKPVSPTEVVEAVAKNENVKSRLSMTPQIRRRISKLIESASDLRLAEDTLFIMAGHGSWDMVNDKYQPNEITTYMVAHPSSIHGAFHFTYEGLLSSAFIYPKLLDTNFEYPFKEKETPLQYAHKKMGNATYAKKHFYEIMYEQGRMESFNTFMEGKFGISPKTLDRIRALWVVDIGGGRGEMLLELKEVYPHLKKENLVLEEFNAAAIPRADITAMDWDFKSPDPQPIVGADVYNLIHICHNVSDIECMRLLKKLAAAMEPHSRLWIQEFSKSLKNANIHAGMIAWLAGRERSSEEWHANADIADLRVTYERYTELGEGLV